MNSGVFYGDAERVLKTLPSGLVQCCVTSPPYWGLRDYSVEGQFGLEATPGEYIERMVGVFREVKRVLRDDGTVWLNLGDSYGTKGSDWSHWKGGQTYSDREKLKDVKISTGLKPKDLCMIPARVALALQADGWWLRSDIIWSKPNPMPESCTDRPTTVHEHVFLLSKRSRYFYDADAIREDSITNDSRKPYGSDGAWALDGRDKYTEGAGQPQDRDASRRNKRTVWEIATAPYAGAHFATFPPKLVEPCILAGTSPRACEKCGAPWKRMVEKSGGTTGKSWHDHSKDSLAGQSQSVDIRATAAKADKPYEIRETGWQPTCSCDSEGKGRCLVLDPFAGSGTTGEVALKHGRDCLLIELNRDYEELIRGRLGLFYAEAEAGE